MKNLVYITILLSLFSLSCEDFINRPPLDRISEDSYWRTTQDLENYTSKFYQSLPSHGNWGSGLGYSESNSVDMIVAPTPNVILRGSRGAAGGRWINDWDNIRSVNIFLDNYKKVNSPLEEYKQYLGEAYFFKAWFYFQLVKQYGNVPWYTHTISLEDSVALNRPRDPRTEVVDSILTNLDNATSYLGYRAGVGNNRINKEAALAFKTRVALFEGTWEKYHAGTDFAVTGADPQKYFQACIDAGEKLISDNLYTKGIYNPANKENPYYSLFGLSNMGGVNEILLYRAYNFADGLNNDVQYITTSQSPSGMGATWSLVSSYLSKEGIPYNYMELASSTKGNDFLRKVAEDVDPRLHATIWIPGDILVTETGVTFLAPRISGSGTKLNPTGFTIKKGSNPSKEAAGGPGGGNSDTGYIIFRYAEVLLNYAEAKYELDNEVAYNALNELRNRVGMPDFSVIPQSSYTNPLDYGYPISDALRAIRNERKVELAIEGHGSENYRRWAAHALFKGKTPKGYPFKQSEFPDFTPPLDDNGLIDFFQNALPNGYQFRPDQDYLSPIPETELTLNPNIEQNPGW